ncbi:MAG: tRNA-dihydrouridine synthase [Clostridia bacterium]|nr:tRNA-dihydrouridine synthase [Clostridia bacterium]
MQLKQIKIGNVITKNNVFVAPLAGFTDSAFRSICYSLGAGLCFTEMVSMKGLKYSPDASVELLRTEDNEYIKAVQIFGNNPDIMTEMVNSRYLDKFDIIDINFGCPVSKIYSNGEGSFLLSDIPLASKIISQIAKTGKTVTCKFRIGLTENNFVTKEFAKMCEDSGAKLISIHGRVKTAIYSGECNFEQIRLAKNSVKIPVIANGGIFTKQDAITMIENTGADGIMLARGVLENPLLISEILGIKPSMSLKDVIIKQIDMTKNRYGDSRSAVVLRKQMAYYLKGVQGSRKLKQEIFTLNSAEKMKELFLTTNLF